MFSTSARSRIVGAILGIVLANVIATSAQAASIFLPPGGFSLLAGNTVAAEPDLAGFILYDGVTHFSMQDAASVTIYEANLQNRVVRSTITGQLHFYYRIRDPNTLLSGSVAMIRTSGFAFQNCWVEYRTDGLGDIGPQSALRSAAPGGVIRFNMPWPGMSAGFTSLFMYVKTTALGYAPGGQTTIFLASGESATIPTVRPL